jgi:hypothetical protein
LKYRFAAANEEHGDYIVTAFLAGSIPYGRFATPYASLAFGKGYRNFDFQSTLGWTIPTGGRQKSGTPVAYNTAFQYRVWRKLWPELEVNATFWPNGTLTGDRQVFLSPGLLAGRFHLWRRLGLSVGAGEQIAPSHLPAHQRAQPARRSHRRCPRQRTGSTGHAIGGRTADHFPDHIRGGA